MVQKNTFRKISHRQQKETMNFIFLRVFVIISFLYSPLVSYAVEVAPRISDREIIESLAELKMGQKNINNRFQSLEKSIDTRFQSFEKNIDTRFQSLEQSIDTRFQSFEQSIGTRFQSIDKRFQSMDKRFAFLETLIMIVITGIFGLIGFIVWDRKTALRPLERKIDKLESELHHDLELQSPEGSRLTRLIHAFRGLAKHDSKVAETLKAFSLL